MSDSPELNNPLCNLELAQRLERAEAIANLNVIRTRSKLFPEYGACWAEVAGAYAMYDGPNAPTTQSFGLGLYQPTTRLDIDRIEKFFGIRGSLASHHVAPLADSALLPLLSQHGYRPVQFTNVMFRPVWAGVQLATPRNDQIHVRPAQDDQDFELYVQAAVIGWSEYVASVNEMGNLLRERLSERSVLGFLAELDGQIIATGTLAMIDGIGVFAEASTVPRARGLGGQLALQECRLRACAAQGCNLAMLGATPDSRSQRNAERHGFRIAYTRTTWRTK